MIHIKCKDANVDPIKVKIGIIGGSGLDDPDILENRREIKVSTPYGDPSDVLIEGDIKGVKCVLLARHGRKHDIMPSNVNYRANIWAMRNVGCDFLIVSTACGSLREEIKPGDLVVPDDFIDRTTKRAQTFYDGSENSPKGVCHLPMHPAYNERVRQVLLSAASELGYEAHKRATIVSIEGPRFSSRSESNLFRQWGADLINMTTCPEVVLAKEAGLLYGSVAISTDYDCWKMGCEGVNVQDVLKTFAENVVKVKQILVRTVEKIAQEDWTDDILDAKLCTDVTRDTILHKSPRIAKMHNIPNSTFAAELQPKVHSISILYELESPNHKEQSSETSEDTSQTNDDNAAESESSAEQENEAKRKKIDEEK